MAGDARTIRVSGLPADMSENRLIDKLQIHFLRKKNSGGEISAVSISKTTQGTAFITFEESEVAVRLAQNGKQIFKVSDKSYIINISLHNEEVDADKVLLSMSLVVDHRKLPGGKDTLFSLHKSVPGVHLAYDLQTEVYTVRGRYSEVQTLSSMLLGALEKQEQSSANKPQPKTYDSPLPTVESASIQVRASDDTEVVEHPNQSEGSDLNMKDKSWKLETGLASPGSSGKHSSRAASAKNKWDSDIESLFEDFSLIVDSDIFRYLHQYCSKEYLSILKQHKVEVLDINNDEITTLYLKPQVALSSRNMSYVIKAHEELVHLYQQKQSQLRKEHVYKPEIPEKELTHALESLRERLPRLMIHEDDRSVYMIGSKSDVSEAKQFISDMRGNGMETETRSEHLFTPSHSKWTSLQQGSAASQDLFMPLKDLLDANQKRMTSETCSKKGQNVDEPIKKTTEDSFDYRGAEVSQEKHVSSDTEWMETGSWLDKSKYTDSLFDFSKASASHSVMDIDDKLFSNPGFISRKMASNSETQIKSSKGYKTKQTETGKERKMAASFSREMCSGSCKSEVPKTDKGAYVSEKNIPDSDQPHSLPIIKPSLSTNLNLNSLRCGTSAQTSTSKMELQELKGDMVPKFLYDNKKPTISPACLSEDLEPESFIAMPLESTLKRSNSFSGKIKNVEEPTAVDVSTGQKGTPQNPETREIKMNVVLPFRLWLYLTSVYNTEIENLTLDLQVKESLDKEDISLCLRGLDSEKVHKCHSGLSRLIASAEVDFISRTLPLSKLGVSDSKDKSLIELCMLLKQSYKMVKILVLSNDIMILGPKPMCDEVENTMSKVFHEQENIANSKLENKPAPIADSLQTSKEPDKLTTSSRPHSDTSVKGIRSGRQNKKKGKKLEQLDKNVPTLLLSDGETKEVYSGGTMNIESGGTMTSNSATKQNKGNGENNTDQKGTIAQSEETLIEQKRPGISINQIRDSQGTPEGSDLKHNIMPSHGNGNQNLCLCCVCKKECSTIKQATCGCNCCLECKDLHDNCRLCEVTGIKGTMNFQESTITIPGFNRDTTLRITYDIPDGIQAEHHPHPGAPFKGNRFEAFLPHNKSTAKLLPLLDKAFHKGLTFTVKAGAPGNDGGREGRVVWGSIPHKTRTEGGASRNGYPDCNYIKRLEEALKATGVGD